MTWATGVARARGLFGPALTHYLDQYNNIAGLGAHGEALPSKDNFVALSDERDEQGLPKPLIHLSYGPNELAIEKHAIATMTQAWKLPAPAISGP